MSSPKRRAQLEQEMLARDAARARVEARVAALTMWALIDEANADSTVKNILHKICEHIGLEK